MNKWVYISLTVLGLTLFIMEIGVADNIELAFTILLLTILSIIFLYLFEEWRFYRRHNALLASSEFILLPLVGLFAGNMIAPLGINGEFIDLNIHLFASNLNFVSTITSLLLILPSYLLINLFSKYYNKRYPGFVVRRRIFRSAKLPFLINILSIILLLATGYFTGYIDFIVLIFVVVSVIQITTKIIIPFVTRETERSRHDTERRRYIESLGSNASRNRSTSNSSSTQTNQRRSGSQVSTQASSGTRTIRTSPSEGYRDIPVRPRNGTSVSTANSGSHTRPTIDTGIEIVPPSRTVRQRKSSKISDYLPKGNFSKEDLKCMICYEDFNQSSNGNVIVCPNCRFPAHERELRAWLAQSERCPRCNKEIKTMGVLRQNSLISVNQYVKILNKI